MTGRAFSRVVRWVRDTFTAGDSTDEQAAEDTEFAGSRLDASVNEAHGMDTRLAKEEVAELQEEAAELDDQHPEE